MKKYIVIISQTFPLTHPRGGEATNFKESIKEHSKIHTLRGNFEYWEKRFKSIEAGEAELIIKAWTGKPYKSKQIELFRFSKTDGIGIQKFEWTSEGIYIDEKPTKLQINQIANSDGLSKQDFVDWFADYPNEPLAILHFTAFRY